MIFVRPKIFDGKRKYTHINKANTYLARVICDDKLDKDKKVVFLEQDRGSGLETVKEMYPVGKTDVYCDDKVGGVETSKEYYLPVKTYKVSFQEALEYARQGFCVSRLTWIDRIIYYRTDNLYEKNGGIYLPSYDDMEAMDWTLADWEYGIVFRKTGDVILRSQIEKYLQGEVDKNTWYKWFLNHKDIEIRLMVNKNKLPKDTRESRINANFLDGNDVIFEVKRSNNKNYVRGYKNRITNSPDGDNVWVKDPLDLEGFSKTSDVNTSKSRIMMLSFDKKFEDLGKVDIWGTNQFIELRAHIDNWKVILANNTQIENLLSWKQEEYRLDFEDLIREINLVKKYNTRLIDRNKIEEISLRYQDVMQYDKEQEQGENELLANHLEYKYRWGLREELGNVKTFKGLVEVLKYIREQYEKEDLIKDILLNTDFDDYDKELYDLLIEACHIDPYTNLLKSQYGADVYEIIKLFLPKTTIGIGEYMKNVNPNPRDALDAARLAGEKYLKEIEVYVPTQLEYLKLEDIYWAHELLWKYFVRQLKDLVQREMSEDDFMKIFFMVGVMKSHLIAQHIDEIDRVMYVAIKEKE